MSTEPAPERFFFVEPQEVTVHNFTSQGWVLDVGGGGEGVIGRLKGEQVVAIDLLLSELEEAPLGPLKIVMDARQLKFMDGTFSTATSFFALMFIRRTADIEQVLAEIYRVLKPGGKFLLWDLTTPEKPANPVQDIYRVDLKVHLPEAEVETGYGNRWPEELRSAEFYTRKARAAGFRLSESAQDRAWFFLQFYKPQAARLQEPDEAYEAEFKRYLEEFIQAGEIFEGADLARRDFPAYVRRQRAHARGEDLPEGWVPANTYWLVDEGNRIVGESHLRHRLSPNLEIIGGHIGYKIRPSARKRGYGTHILALTLEKARALALERILVTCDTDNTGSARIIEHNGGVLTRQFILDGIMKSHYWIDLKEVDRNGV